MQNIFEKATQALEGTKDSKTKLKIVEQWSDIILQQIYLLDDELWKKEFEESIYRFLIEAFSFDFLKMPSYCALCGLYLHQICLTLQKKWEKIFDYRLKKDNIVLRIFKKTFTLKLTPFNRFFVRHFLHFKNDIDLVYLWCDNNDAKWRQKRLKALKKFCPNASAYASNQCRFVDNDELRRSLRSARIYAPWIHKIYIITDGQIPKWLKTSNKKIKVIDHKDIIAKEYLPTFNANVIESSIHHIKGLSEYFLFSNDDTFFGQPVKKDFFFSADGKPYARLHKMPSIFKIVESTYLKLIVYMSYLHKKHGGKTYLLNPHHNIDAYTKSIFEDMEKTFADKLKKWRKNHFRTDHDFHRVVVYYQALDHKNAILKPISSQVYKSIDSMVLRLERKDIYQNLKTYRPKLFCINDNENATDKDRKNIRKLYQKLFPHKSSFEK